MKKSNFAALILGTIGTVFFALGMCMCLCMVFSYLVQGVVVGLIGIVALLFLIPLTKGLK